MGFIYKLASIYDERVYVGKTTRRSPKQTMKELRRNYKLWLYEKWDYSIEFELLVYNDCQMIVLEDNVPNDQLSERERPWVEFLNCVNTSGTK